MTVESIHAHNSTRIGHIMDDLTAFIVHLAAALVALLAGHWFTQR